MLEEYRDLYDSTYLDILATEGTIDNAIDSMDVWYEGANLKAGKTTATAVKKAKIHLKEFKINYKNHKFDEAITNAENAKKEYIIAMRMIKDSNDDNLLTLIIGSIMVSFKYMLLCFTIIGIPLAMRQAIDRFKAFADSMKSSRPVKDVDLNPRKQELIGHLKTLCEACDKLIAKAKEAKKIAKGEDKKEAVKEAVSNYVSDIIDTVACESSLTPEQKALIYNRMM